MSKERKPIASIEIFQNEAEDDYDIVGYVRISGIKIEIDTNMNNIRDFFTRRRGETAVETKRRRLGLTPVQGAKEN